MAGENIGYSGPVLQLSEVTFGYDPKKPIFNNVTMDISTSCRIALLGANGTGKSTLLDLIAGKIQPNTGKVVVNNKLKISYFTQHHTHQLELELTPLEHLHKRFPSENPQSIRAHLGSFGIHGHTALQKMTELSGGQKSRVVLATILWERPHILILDEPTNHLDIDTIDALIFALQQFQGGIVFVSHDQHMITALGLQLWEVKNRSIVKYEGSFETYKNRLLARMPKTPS